MARIYHRDSYGRFALKGTGSVSTARPAGAKTKRSKPKVSGKMGKSAKKF